jgi:hypothetical protein
LEAGLPRSLARSIDRPTTECRHAAAERGAPFPPSFRPRDSSLVIIVFFPSKGATTRLVGARRLEQSDEPAVPRARYSPLAIITQLSDDPGVKSPDVAA